MIGLRLLLPVVLMFSVLSLSAGRFDIWNHWAWLGVVWFSGSLTSAVLGRVSPELLAERMKPPSDRDRATRRLVALPFLTLLVVSGLDVRWHWSTVSVPLQVLGLALVALGFALVAWVLLTNPFASSAVRIQQERGQKVIDAGPYAWVRHPMYLAVALVCLGSGVALRSYFGALTLIPVVLIFVRRTLIEDQMLHSELEGYRDYAARTRWRVIPGLF